MLQFQTTKFFLVTIKFSYLRKEYREYLKYASSFTCEFFFAKEVNSREQKSSTRAF